MDWRSGLTLDESVDDHCAVAGVWVCNHKAEDVGTGREGGNIEGEAVRPIRSVDLPNHATGVVVDLDLVD